MEVQWHNTLNTAILYKYANSFQPITDRKVAVLGRNQTLSHCVFRLRHCVIKKSTSVRAELMDAAKVSSIHMSTQYT